MRRIIRFFFIIILAFSVFCIGYFLEHYKEFYPHASTLEVGFFIHLGHLFIYGGYALIIWVLIEESIRSLVLPVLREFLKDDFLGELFNELRAIRDTVAEVLKEQGLIKIVPVSTEEEKQDEKIVEDIFKSEMGSDYKLREAEKLVKDGDYQEAVAILEQLSKQDTKYIANLITTLVFSPEPEHWLHAENLLSESPEFAEPIHFIRLAYKEWLRSNCQATLRLGERALETLNNKSKPVDEGIELRAINSLAYYYADCNSQSNAEKALSYANEAVKRTVHKKDTSDHYRLAYARRLATLGYVKITFGKTKKDIEEGIHDCEEGRRLGSSEELYFRHLARAQSRWSDIIQCPDQ